MQRQDRRQFADLERRWQEVILARIQALRQSSALPSAATPMIGSLVTAAFHHTAASLTTNNTLHAAGSGANS